jgi:arylamine N-acetyltransferase
MVNIVTIDNQRYLVDVGFGIDNPPKPIPLISGYETAGIFPKLYKLTYTRLPQHSDDSQRVWVYSHRQPDGPWVDGFCFSEIEFFPLDFEVLNHSVSTKPQSFFLQVIMCMKTLLNPDTNETEGMLTLFQNEVKRRIGGISEVVETLRSEEDRVRALEKWFGIVLAENEKRGIMGLATQLRDEFKYVN